MTETAPGREARVIRVFVELADTLVDDYDVIDLLDRLAGSSVELLAANAAGILLGDAESTLRVVATTNEQVEWMELQLQAEEGPVWTATAAVCRSVSPTSPMPPSGGPSSSPR